MTESDWLACRDPQLMVQHLKGAKTTDRKMRLFVCACCRRLWSHCPSEHIGRLIELGVKLAAGLTTDAVLRSELRKLPHGLDGGIVIALMYLITPDKYDWPTAANSAAWVLRNSWRDYVRGGIYMTVRDDPGVHKDMKTALVTSEYGARPAIGQILDAAWAKEGQSQAQLLRDIVGNPFRAKVLNPACRTSHVTSVAQNIYDTEAFFRLPVLAALLAEAGCDDAEIVGHCTNHEPHAKGCWVLDQALGRT
jgi:hypothetical protein